MSWTASIATEHLGNYSPFRTPEWRWREARRHLKQQTLPGIWDDPGVAKAYQFLFDVSDADTEAERAELVQRWPDLTAAKAIFMQPGVQRDELEARLICEPIDVIAGKMGIPSGVVGAFAEAFFDVADSVNATDWMMLQAVGLHRFSLPPTEGECWRYLAFFGGPFVLDLMVADHLDRPEPTCPDRHLHAERARFLVRDHVSLLKTGQPADPEIIEEH